MPQLFPPSSASTPLVSIVIPTVGRSTLVDAVRSVLTQQGVDVEVIVVQARPGAGEGLGINDGRVRFLGGSVLTTSQARSIGLIASKGQFIAFLDDDDLHLPGHLRHAVDFLTGHPSTIYCCRALVRYSAFARVEPTVTANDIGALDYLFGPDVWRSRRRRVLTPTVVFDKRYRGVPIPESNAIGEDTRWLLETERQGARLHLDEYVGALVLGDQQRESVRTAKRDECSLADDLAYAPGNIRASAYVSGPGRDAARVGDVSEALRLTRKAFRQDPSARWLLIGVAHATVAAGVRLIRAMKSYA